VLEKDVQEIEESWALYSESAMAAIVTSSERNYRSFLKLASLGIIIEAHRSYWGLRRHNYRVFDILGRYSIKT
jgi:hypothetical protein